MQKLLLLVSKFPTIRGPNIRAKIVGLLLQRHHEQDPQFIEPAKSMPLFHSSSVDPEVEFYLVDGTTHIPCLLQPSCVHANWSIQPGPMSEMATAVLEYIEYDLRKNHDVFLIDPIFYLL